MIHRPVEERIVIWRVGREVVIGLVDEYIAVRWKSVNQGFEIFSCSEAGGSIIRIADINQRWSIASVSKHRVQIVRVAVGKGNLNDFSSGSIGVVADGFEGRCGNDQLPSCTKEPRNADTQNLRRAATGHNLLWLHFVQVRDSPH